MHDVYSNPAIGCRLRAMRFALRISQGDVADAVGRDRNYISKWERGVVLPSAAALAPMWDTFGVDFNYLFGGRVAHLPHSIAADLIAELRREARADVQLLHESEAHLIRAAGETEGGRRTRVTEI